jgi:acyl-CoA synthetase (NDP forming)
MATKTAPIPAADALATVVDKAQTVELAERVGVPVPRSWCPASADDAAALARELDERRADVALASAGSRAAADEVQRFERELRSASGDVRRRVAFVGDGPWVGQGGVARVKTFEQLDAWLRRQLH